MTEYFIYDESDELKPFGVPAPNGHVEWPAMPDDPAFSLPVGFPGVAEAMEAAGNDTSIIPGYHVNLKVLQRAEVDALIDMHLARRSMLMRSY